MRSVRVGKTGSRREIMSGYFDHIDGDSISGGEVHARRSCVFGEFLAEHGVDLPE